MSKIFSITLCCFLLISCQSGKNKSTDNSADYSKTVIRKPLNKNITAKPVIEKVVLPILNANLIQNSKHTKLEVVGDFEIIWGSFTSYLAASNVTVFTKSKDKKQIFIGCAGIDELGGQHIKNKKRFFSKVTYSDYCELRMKKRKNAVVISVYQRNQKEAPTTLTQAFFQKLQYVNIQK